MVTRPRCSATSAEAGIRPPLARTTRKFRKAPRLTRGIPKSRIPRSVPAKTRAMPKVCKRGTKLARRPKAAKRTPNPATTTQKNGSGTRESRVSFPPKSNPRRSPARKKSRRITVPRSRKDEVFENCKDFRVEVPLFFVLHDFQRLIHRVCPPVGALRG